MDYSSLPRFPSSNGPADSPGGPIDSASPSEVSEVTCPLCGGRTNHIQVYEVPIVVFVLVYVTWGHGTVAGCPSCVRAALWRQFWVSLVSANVLFPFVGPIIFSQINASGESVVPTIPPEYHAWKDVKAEVASDWAGKGSGRGLRLWIALVVIVCAAVAMFVILPLVAG